MGAFLAALINVYRSLSMVTVTWWAVNFQSERMNYLVEYRYCVYHLNIASGSKTWGVYRCSGDISHKTHNLHLLLSFYRAVPFNIVHGSGVTEKFETPLPCTIINGIALINFVEREAQRKFLHILDACFSIQPNDIMYYLTWLDNIDIAYNLTN